MRSVSGKDAVKAFIMAGGIVRQGKGDHANIKMPNGQLITIPVSGGFPDSFPDEVRGIEVETHVFLRSSFWYPSKTAA
jgi:predicted RNA binding protein YcfA (HicA-like mRNA interferase family)